MDLYRVELTTEHGTRIINSGITRDNAIDIASKYDTERNVNGIPRIYNNFTGDEVVHGFDGKIEEV